jgi:hypothetical protein
MIRFGLGFLIVFGAVGGIDNATDAQLIPLVIGSLIGLTLMYFGSEKLKN